MTESVNILPSVEGIEQISVVFQKTTAVSQLITGAKFPTQLLDLVVPVQSRIDITNKHECLLAVPRAPAQPSISETAERSATVTWDIMSATYGGPVESYYITSNIILQEINKSLSRREEKRYMNKGK